MTKVYCEECGKRVNGTNAVRTHQGMAYYCKKHYNELVPEDNTGKDKCMYCTNFKYATDKWWNLRHFQTLGDTNAIYGECSLHDKTVSTLSIACNDFNNGFGDNTPWCSEKYILHSANNDWCRKEEKNFNCEKCSIRKFWLEVLEEKDCHIIENDNVMSFTTEKGGFYNQRFNIYFKDTGETLENMGLWHRGLCPNQLIKDNIRQAVVTTYKGGDFE